MIVCGFPRSGTSLTLILLYGSVTNYPVRSDREGKKLEWQWRDGQEVILKGPHLLAQFPERPVILVRDPRSVVTSKVGDSYFIGLGPPNGRTLGIYGLFEIIRDHYSSGCIVKYEDLVRDPDSVQRRIGEWWGLEYSRPWSEYPNNWNIPLIGMWARKMNGIRPIDQGHDWRDHMDRLEQQDKEQMREILAYFNYD